MYNNKGLVSHCEASLKRNTKYMWGGIMRAITKNYIDTLRSIYSTQSGTGYTLPRYNELYALALKGGYYGCDCVGLIKSYYWSKNGNTGGTGSPNYGKVGCGPDVNASTMYNNAKKKGPISSIPEIPGLIVYSRSHPHVGVYIGNGYVIECTLSNRGDGVVKSKLKDWSGWEYWFQCPYINYETDNVKYVTKTVKYTCNARSKPELSGKLVTKYYPGATVTVEINSDSYDSKSKYTYVKIKDKDEWIVKSAI